MTARWIVGIDGSDAAVDALRWTVAQGAGRDAEITAIGAYHVPAIMAVFAAKRGFGVDELGLAATAAHDVDVAIEAAGEAAGTGAVPSSVPSSASASTESSVVASVVASVVEGQAQHVLVDAAADADLLVIGRTGSGELRHHLLGSVSQYCVTHSPAPVAVVPSGAAPRTTVSIVVGFDGSEHAAEAVRWALGFADATARVRVVAAVEVAPWVDEDMSRDRFGDEIRREEERIAGALDLVDPGGRAERSIVFQGPRQALAEAQADADADMVVVGSRGRGLIAVGLLGSVSTWLLHDADFPVVIVPSR